MATFQFKVGEAAALLARLYQRELGEALAPLGIAPGQYAVLQQLWTEDGINQKQLVDALGVEQATMANTLIRMERDGLIRREKNKDDTRSRRIFLTAKARVAEMAAKDAERMVTDKAARGLYSSDQERMMALLQKVTANLSGQI